MQELGRLLPQTKDASRDPRSVETRSHAKRRNSTHILHLSPIDEVMCSGQLLVHIIGNAKRVANGVSGNPKNFGMKIKSHEKRQAHLDANIASDRRKAGQRIDRVQEKEIVTESRKYLNCFG